MTQTRQHSTSIGNDLKDTVSVKNLKFSCQLYNQQKHLNLSLDLKTSFLKAGLTDDLKYSINYAVLSRAVKEFESANENKHFTSFKNLGESLFKDVIFKQNSDHASLNIDEHQSSNSVQVKLHRSINRDDSSITTQENSADTLKICDLKLMTIIGVFTEERFTKQPVVLDITVHPNSESSLWTGGPDKLVSQITKYIENSNFKTVEALVLNVCKLVYQISSGVEKCEVKVIKPDAIDYTDGVGVSVIRTKQEIEAEVDDVVAFDSSDVTVDKFSIPNLNSETAAIAQSDEHKSHTFCKHHHFTSPSQCTT
ncbi:unnamed protein product [Ambrosiozyma monospora]|uniref:Unnamed protein product n=1 Tax=Ambrosiozyma monospora TaxID=43982 RepID=A0ACB5TAL4_AMBMO|nr:unnamed protein product [Ambrosiozyma monospora]